MIVNLLQQASLNTILFSSAILLVAISLATLLKRSAPAVYLCCLSGLFLATAVPVLTVFGETAETRQFVFNVPSQINALAPRVGNSENESKPKTNQEPAGEEKETTNTRGQSTKLSPQTAIIEAKPLPISDLKYMWRWITSIWITGSAFLFFRLLVSVLAVRQLVNKSIRVPDGEIASGILENLGKIQLRSSNQVSSPVAACWPKRAIILPQQFLFRNSKATILRVVEHERAHVVRRDQWTLLFESLVTCLYWFNPLVYVTRKRLDDAREDICDNFVLAKSNSMDYCKDLVSISRDSQSTPGLLPGFVGSRKLKHRVRSLLNPLRRTSTTTLLRTKLGVASMMFAFASLSCFAGFNFLQDEDKTPDFNTPEYREKLGKAMSQFQTPDSIQSRVVDQESGEAIEGAQIQLVAVDPSYVKQRIVRTTVSDHEGNFQFTNLNQVEGFPSIQFVVVVSKVKKATAVVGIRSSVDYLLNRDTWKIELKPAAVLAGRVLEPDGTPVVGAWVYQPIFLAGPIANVRSAQTDEGGWFKILDHMRYRQPEPRRNNAGVTYQSAGTGMIVWHPEYGRRRFNVTKIPDRIKIELPKGFTVKGKAVDKLTGQPIAGLTVHASGHSHRSSENTSTDENGEFSVTLLPDSGFEQLTTRDNSAYNIWVRHPELDAAAQTVSGRSGQTITIGDFQLESLITVKGVVIDEDTDKPLVSEDKRYRIHWHGDTRPRTTGEVKGTSINADGTFEMKVLAGTIMPYLGSAALQDSVKGGKYKKGIQVTRDRPIELEFRARVVEVVSPFVP